MAIWKLLTLAKLIKKMKLNFWNLVLQEYVTIRNKEANKNFNKMSDSSLTEVNKQSTKSYLKKKITDAGGKTKLNYLSHFNKNNKINTEDFYRIDHIVDENWNIPKKEELEEFLNIDKLSTKQYENLETTAKQTKINIENNNKIPKDDSTIDTLSSKIINNSKEKLRSGIYKILTDEDARKDNPIIEK